MAMRHEDLPPRLSVLTDRIIGAAIEVHRHLGPGLLERVYEDALCHEMGLRGIRFERQRPIVVDYKGVQIPGQRLDLVVEGTAVVELKSTEGTSEAHLAQLVSYIRSGGYPVGLLMNFNVAVLKSGIFRRINAAALDQTPRPQPSPSVTSASPSAPSAF